MIGAAPVERLRTSARSALGVMALGVVTGWATASAPPALWLVAGGVAALLAVLARPDLVVALLGLAIPVGVEIPLHTLETGFTISESLYTRTTVSLSLADLLLGLLAVALLLLAAFDADLRRRLRTPLSGALLVFWLAAGLSLAAQWGTLPQVAFLICTLYWIRLGEVFCVYFIVIALVRRRETWERCFRASFVGAILLAANALTLKLLYPVPAEDWKPPINLAMQFSGEVGNFFILWTALALGLFALLRRDSGRSLLLLLAGGTALATLLLAKRALLLGLLVALIVLGVLVRRAFPLGRLLFLSVLLVPLALLALPERLGERLAATFTADQETWQTLRDEAREQGVPLPLVDAVDAIPLDPSTRHRMIRWIIGVAAFLHHPFVGVGFWASPWAGVGFTHNQYLQVLAEMGLIGFAALVSLLVAMTRTLRPIPARALGAPGVALRWGLIASAISLAVQGIGGSPLLYFNFLLAFLYLVGLLVAGDRLGAAAEEGG